MSALHLPPAEPPDDLDLHDVLEDLYDARAELVEARRVAALIACDEPSYAHTKRRQRIELEVAGRRAELWAAEVRTLEVRAREMGRRP